MSKWHFDICEANIHGFNFEKDLLLFNEQTQELFLLNLTSKIVWEGINAGYSKDRIIRILTKATEFEPAQIRSDVDSIVSQWKDLGLFKHRPKKTPPTAPLKKGKPLPAKFYRKKTYGCRFKIIETVFEFDTPDENCLILVIEHLSHLIFRSKKPPHVNLYLTYTENQFQLYKNKRLADTCSSISGIIPMIHALTLMTAYDRSDCLLGLHASAVMNGQAAIVMPAASGKGKSTLTAAMIQSGFSYGADDLVLLCEAPGQIIPVPSAIGVKPDSWPVIANWHPEIKNCREHIRSDKKIVRYLPIKDKTIGPDKSSHPIRADYIVYPSYTPGATCHLEQISPAQSVVNLTNAGFDLHKRFDRHLVQQLVDWIKATPSFTLSFSNLEEAIIRLKSLTN